jgi:hypothetical protein
VEIRRTLDLTQGELVELRVLAPGCVWSGYFDRAHRAHCAENAAKNSGQGGVYITLNPVLPALHARAFNRLVPFAKVTTADADVQRRTFLLVDLDPNRPSSVSSTDSEHAAALSLAQKIAIALSGEGWPDPAIIGDSGNGAHLIYSIGLPNDSTARDLLKNLLAALALRFSDNVVAVDLTTFNAARISKLYGTVAAKGDSTPTSASAFADHPKQSDSGVRSARVTRVDG